ncbi:YcxB family protein [Laspinema olomoucense]|uniref:YcxB family protein n=1 Tax=Laspinema olomoucense TaxID=3231600 RepID=UPI0021BA5654|nr:MULTISPECIES: YcxB family protein [unclassified Laspinema]MCT7971491.1 YcxB family protein [Laspinema sp. D3d]MCT7987361.1 YcxB family protein [Laspinema sp. D3a]MCT7992076.1 YcxB family protein [Laspinema sp. D3c]
MAMSLEFTLKPQDFEESFMIYHNSKPYLRYTSIFMIYVLIIFVGFLAALKIHALINNDVDTLKRVDDSLLVFTGLALLICNPGFWYKLMTAFMWKVGHFLKEPVLVQIEESMFIYKNAVMKSEIQWSSIQSVTESNHIFFIVHRLQASYIVPKRIFTEENINEFKQILASNNILIQKG